MANQANAKQKLSFEKALERLEQIVDQIESGKVPLEESIDKYAQGIELIKQCRSILESAERKIQVLAKGEGQDVRVTGSLEEGEEA
ncbi:MAG: Exodeoxyribonuclease 7 small subunit [Planctomycetes bacterium ADurb.Bin126]|nr:MAG: Exodeoxyribonuclease 7 small subunit [Planctomycetes bacterium ADurb.Bin126]HOD81413.1 exodeoxyribonuclease VII small subunit [Phycisphaerae bacterium]HQL73826.1 exodeoxyribonuclease VII small subunit [Phycisphaerae bacterium]